MVKTQLFELRLNSKQFYYKKKHPRKKEKITHFRKRFFDLATQRIFEKFRYSKLQTQFYSTGAMRQILRFKLKEPPLLSLFSRKLPIKYQANRALFRYYFRLNELQSSILREFHTHTRTNLSLYMIFFSSIVYL